MGTMTHQVGYCDDSPPLAHGKRVRKAFQAEGGDIYNDREGVESDHLQAVYFYAMGARLCWVLEVFKKMFKKKTHPNRIVSQLIHLCY